MYKEVGNRYEFDGDFEQYLLGVGVSANHIKMMKERKLQADKERYFSIKEDEKKELVSLQKVIGTCRGTVGVSVFENVRTMWNWERKPDRFENWFKRLERMSLDRLKKLYEELDYPVEMAYYKDEDEYFLIGDGNHRTLTAMLLGAEYIKSNVMVKVCDYEKKEKYFAERNFYTKYNISNIISSETGRYKIIFRWRSACYEVNGFESAKANENCYDLINRLSREIERDNRKAELWYKVPVKLRNFLRRFFKDKRFFQYIEKRNPSDINCGGVILCEF